MSKIVMYVRVSSKIKQDYERQISDLSPIIRNHYSNDPTFDFDNDVEIYAEKISGYKKDYERPELNKLLNKVYSSPSDYKCIYITEISRLGRDPKNTREIYDTLTELRVPIYVQSVGQYSVINSERNNTLSIAIQILMEFADTEAKTFKQRAKSGKLQKVNDGRIHGSNLAYGYMGDANKKLIPDPEETPVVELIFQLYKEGNGIQSIANTLNHSKIPTRRNKTHGDKSITFKDGSEKSGATIIWDDNTILSILKNTIYKGERNFKVKDAVTKVENGKKVIVTPAEYGTFNAPAIISPELFDECTQIRLSKTNRNYLTTYEYLLKDLFRCGCCGRKFFARYSQNMKVYVCTSNINKGESCGEPRINISYIESVIYNELLQSENLLKYLDNPNDLKKQIDAELKILEQQKLNEEKFIESKKKELVKLLDLYTSTKSSNKEYYLKKESTLNKELEASQDKLTIIKGNILSKNIALSKYDEKSASTEMILGAMHNRPELSTIFRQFIDKIIINTITKNYTLITVFIKINGIPLKLPLKLILDVNASRGTRWQRPIEYKYISILNMVNEPIFKENVLKTDIDDIKTEIENIAELATKENFGLLDVPQFKSIPRSNWLYIDKSDI